jgi:hypothetical protein
MIYIYESFITYSPSFSPVFAKELVELASPPATFINPRPIFQPNLHLPTLYPTTWLVFDDAPIP